MYSIYSPILLLMTILFSIQDVNCDQLKLVLIVHRHGDRNPGKPFPKDPYQDVSKFWPEGLVSLRKEGKRRLFRMGQIFRRRYKEFLSYDPNEVYARSSGADRCLQSSASLLASLYQPLKNDTNYVFHDEQLDWQPIAIHTKEREKDGLLYESSICDVADKEMIRIRSSDAEVVNFTKNHSKLFQLLEEKTGLKNLDYFVIGDKIYDNLMIEKSIGYQLPDWVTSGVYNQLQNINNLHFYFDHKSEIILKFRAGLMFKEIKYRMEYAAHRDSNMSIPTPDIDIEKVENMESKKIFIYSTHDSILSAMLATMNKFNGIAPTYGASIIFELYSVDANQTRDMKRDINNSYLWKAFYWNDTNNDISTSIPLKFEGCKNQTFCSIDMLPDIAPKDWVKECSNHSSRLASLSMISILLVVISSIYSWI